MNWEAIGALGEILAAITVVVTLVYLAIQVRHSKELLERNEKITLSQVHQARADSRINLHLSSAAFENSEKYAAIWENPDAVDDLNPEERARAQNMMLASTVLQDNALYQAELGLLDQQTLQASTQIIVANYTVWKKLGIVVSARVERCYVENAGTSGVYKDDT